MTLGWQEIIVILVISLLLFFFQRAKIAKMTDTALGEKALEKEKEKRAINEFSDPQILSIVHKLESAPRKATHQVRIFQIDDRQVNAMSLPGGMVLLTKGMYQAFQANDLSTDEMAAVIAHEMGHSDLSHSRKRVSDSLVVDTVTNILTGGRSFLARSAGKQIAKGGLNLYHQKDEYEADQYAFQLLRNTEFAENALETALSKFASRERLDVISWLTRHPPTRERISRLSGYRGHA